MLNIFSDTRLKDSSLYKWLTESEGSCQVEWGALLGWIWNDGDVEHLSRVRGAACMDRWKDYNNNCQVHAVQIIKFSSQAASVIQATVAKNID